MKTHPNNGRSYCRAKVQSPFKREKNIFVVDFDNIKDVEKFKFLFPDDFNNKTIQEETKKGAHFYFLRPAIFDEHKIFHRTKIFKDNRLNNNWQQVKLILIQLNILGIIHFSYVPNPGWFLWILQLMFHN